MGFAYEWISLQLQLHNTFMVLGYLLSENFLILIERLVLD